MGILVSEKLNFHHDDTLESQTSFLAGASRNLNFDINFKEMPNSRPQSKLYEDVHHRVMSRAFKTEGS